MELENKAAPGSSAFSHLNMALNAKKNKVAARQALPSHPCCQKERLDRRKYANEQYFTEMHRSTCFDVCKAAGHEVSLHIVNNDLFSQSNPESHLLSN